MFVRVFVHAQKIAVPENKIVPKIKKEGVYPYPVMSWYMIHQRNFVYRIRPIQTSIFDLNPANLQLDYKNCKLHLLKTVK